MATVELKPNGVRALSRAVPALLDGFRRHDLMLFASAIAFQILTSVVPLALFALGLLGFLDLTEVWQRDLRPHIMDSVSAPALQVIDDTVRRVLGGKQLFWVTMGALLAVWQVSGAVRAAMDALNRVHEAEETRSFGARYVRSLLLAVAGIVLVLLAMAVVVAAPLAYGELPGVLAGLALVARWVVAAALLFLAVGLLVRHGPDCPKRLGWVSVGAGLVIVIWLAMSALFGVYLTTVASYGSLFGNLATVVVLMGYLYASAVTFVAGIEVDALVRERAG
jgi:membrane protein